MPPTRRPRVLLLFLLCLATIFDLAGCGSGGTPIVPQPAFSPAPGNYNAPQQVTLTDPLPDAVLYYTTDGTAPTGSSTRYTAGILIASTTTLEVTAIIPGYRNSPAVAATYDIAQQSAATPTFTPPAGAYSSAQSVAMLDSTPNAQIFYTTDGSQPTSASMLYATPIQVASTETLKAIATAPNFADSAVATATYTIALLPAAAPTFSPPPGTYTGPQTIEIADSTPNATIFYTTNGTTPTTASTPYTAPFPIASTTTVQAIATAPNYAQSPAATATYTIALPTAAAPTFNPPGGTYSTSQTISLTDSTPNSSIFYTSNGTTPTTSSTPFTSPFTISSTATVEAIATAPNYAQSPAATATYTIGSQPSGKGMWTWMGGSTVANQPPVYGTLGVPSSATTPGDNLGSLTFPGPNGTFLLFGGTNDGSLGVRNALWQYNPASSEWTWLAGADTGNPAGIYGTQGVPSTTSQPPPRYSAPTWSDAAGKLYFFGGNSDPKGYNQALSDFWTYNSSTGAWTWIDGSAVPDSYGSPGTIGVPSPSNLPTSRSDSGSCSDNQGNFWMFGGGGPYPPLGNIAYFNDLWQYDPNTGNWTWYTGGMQGNQAGVYGVQGTPDAANTPGGRFYMPCWTDLNGKLWFFGGYGYDITGSDQGFLENNDLWTFDPVTHLWTWIGGSNTHNQLGVYGTLGQPASGNIPGARDDTTHWTDRNGDLWLFGGAVMNPYYGVPTVANDLWRYNIASGQWTWMSGDPSGPSGGPSIYGTLGVPAPGNTPSARDSAVTWVDSQGNLWLFGGFGYDSSGNGGNLSDLWRYQP